jgi:3-methyladenine DNA glycosylase/8-oxoguanine DNA glycosylase
VVAREAWERTRGVPVAADRVVPPAPLRLPGRTADGTTVGDRREVRRLVHLDGAPVVLRARLGDDGAVELEATADAPEHADLGLERARFWSWTRAEDDVTAFLARFADDPLIGESVTAAPWLRPYRRPMPFDVLLGAVCEQLVTDERATAIKRAVTAAHGRRHDGLLGVPAAEDVARLAPAQLEACGLAAKRAVTLVAVAREVAAGRVDLLDPERQRAGWERLRRLPGVGAWTLSTLALHGQGHADALPAGDHAYQTVVARLRRSRRKATEAEVVDFFAPYRPWRGVAGWHVLRTARVRGLLPRT